MPLQSAARAYPVSHGGRLRGDYQRQNELGWRLGSAFQGHLRPHMCLCGQRSHERLRSFADRDVFRKRKESVDCPVQISTCPWMTITVPGVQPVKVQPSVPVTDLCEPAKVQPATLPQSAEELCWSQWSSVRSQACCVAKGNF